ncbi:hypothetical protein JQS43_02090 [Natronosporangium hydrolyticum]|uniref:Uncharacterized protein n=1 Tax=Natronosporangium hydrolyticum TaxID=2811111 RepID=A0A895YGI5_9ACTN|nr:hypothetical protein [Natronosporangium hydrolyticum]QSB15185.1 hypothetical protein JQS43_02090 [Natronosporangium hydrolyticum]
MGNRSRLALGLAGGYLLGRYRKTRWLLAVAALVASKRLGEAALARGGDEGGEGGGSSPELKKLADQGRETAASLLANQMRGLSSRIHSKTESLQQSSAESTESPAEPSAQEAGGQDEEAGGQDEEAAEQEEEAAEQPKDQATSETQPESSAPSNSKGSTKGGTPARRSGGSRGGGAASGERAQVSGRPDGLGAARRRR